MKQNSCKVILNGIDFIVAYQTESGIVSIVSINEDEQATDISSSLSKETREKIYSLVSKLEKARKKLNKERNGGLQLRDFNSHTSPRVN